MDVNKIAAPSVMAVKKNELSAPDAEKVMLLDKRQQDDVNEPFRGGGRVEKISRTDVSLYNEVEQYANNQKVDKLFHLSIYA